MTSKNCCGLSWKRIAKFIAILDLVVTYSTYVGYVVEKREEMEQPPTHGPLDGFNFTATYSEGKIHETTMVNHKSIIQSMAFLLLALMVVSLWLIYEVIICRTLLGAAKHGDADRCQQWIWKRTICSVLVCIVVVGCILLTPGNHGLAFFAIFCHVARIFAIMAVYEFKKELLATNASSRTVEIF